MTRSAGFAITLIVLALVAGCGSEKNTSDAADLADSIVFVSVEQPDKATLTAVPARGGSTRTIMEDVGPRAVLSPDRTRVAWVETTPADDPDFGSTLWVSDLDGRRKHRLVSRSHRLDVHAWSPDGTRLLVSGLGLTVVHVDSRRSSQLSLTLDGSADWSPDGTEVVVADGGLTILSVETGEQRRLTQGGFPGSPSWSPTGREIAYVEYALNGESAIFVADAAGERRPRQLTRRHDDGDPSWSPDGSRIVFVRGPRDRLGSLDELAQQLREAEVFVMAADGTDVRRVTDNDVEERLPVWGGRDPMARPAPATAERVVVPRVRGLSIDEALEQLATAGLRSKVSDVWSRRSDPDAFGSYRVVLQVPEEGTEVSRGRIVELLVLDMTGPFAGRPFDAEIWRRNSTCVEGNPRGRMVTDLLERHLVRGTSRSAVIALLGNADAESGRRIEYALGPWSGARLDCDLLVIEFDAGGKLVRADVEQT